MVSQSRSGVSRADRLRGGLNILVNHEPPCFGQGWPRAFHLMLQSEEPPRTDLLSLAGYLSRYSRILAWGALLVFLGVRGLLALVPDRYEARASFAPSGPGGADLGALGALGGMAASLGLGTGGQQGAKFYADLAQSDVVILRSLDTLQRGVAADVPPIDYVVLNELEAKSPELLRELALRHFRDNLTVEFDARTSVVTVAVTAKEPQHAYAATRAVIAALDRFNVDLLQSTARARSRFLEEKIAGLRAERAAAEAALGDFLLRNRQFQFSPTLALREAELRQLFEAKNASLMSLQSTLEKSRIEQTRDTPVLMMLDAPRVPVTPSGPKRTLFALQLAFLWIALGCLVLSVRSVLSYAAARRPEEMRQIQSDLARLAPLPRSSRTSRPFQA